VCLTHSDNIERGHVYNVEGLWSEGVKCVLMRVAVCCSVLQCVAVCCSVFGVRALNE